MHLQSLDCVESYTGYGRTQVIGKMKKDERVWGKNCDGVLRLDTELDQGIGEVLNPLGPGVFLSAQSTRGNKRRIRTRRNTCSTRDALHLDA